MTTGQRRLLGKQLLNGPCGEFVRVSKLTMPLYIGALLSYRCTFLVLNESNEGAKIRNQELCMYVHVLKTAAVVQWDISSLFWIPVQLQTHSHSSTVAITSSYLAYCQKSRPLLSQQD